MPDLRFRVTGAKVVPHTASPLLAFELYVVDAEPIGAIHAVVLQCQIRIEPQRRRYDAGEQAKLGDLFGEPHRWGQTLRSMLWTHANVVVPAFTGNRKVDLHVPCSFDFNVAATKYFTALEDGEVPLKLLFSGTVFHSTADEAMQVAPIAWTSEVDYRLSVAVWREMMDHYYPNTAWLCLRRDVFDRLHQFKIDRGLPTWEQAVEKLLGEL